MKYCTKCGTPNDDNVPKCSNCSEIFEVEGTIPPPPPVNSPEIAYTVPQPPPPLSQNPIAGEKNPVTLWLILNIILTALCCLTNIAGIIGIIFSAIGMGSFNNANMADAQAKAKIAKIMFFVGLGLGVLGIIIYVVVVVGIMGTAYNVSDFGF